MSDSLKIKREPVDSISSADLSNNTPSERRVTLEQVVRCADDKRKYELLTLFSVELLKLESVEIDEFFSALTLLKLLIPPQNLLNTNNNLLEKTSEILLQYVKILRLNSEFDEVWGGIKDCNKLFQMYKLIHEEGCKYLLPNVKAGEFFNKFLCQLISSSSSVSFFYSVVMLYRGKIEEIFSKYKGNNVSTEDVRVIISIMKTLLTITKAFGSPPAPRELLCSVSISVLKNTKAHLCTLYSYNLLAFLIKDVTDKSLLDKLFNGLSSLQIDQVTSLVKECNSLANTSTWKFKHTFNTTTENTVNNSTNDNITPVTNANATFRKNNSMNNASNEHTVESVKRKLNVVDNNMDSNKRRKKDAPELPVNWYKELMSKFETNRGEGKSMVVDKNAWKWKNDALTNTLKMVEGVESVDLQPVEAQFISLFEGLFKYESAIPVVINSLNLYRVLLVKGNCDFLSGGKSQLLAELLFEKLKESNRKVRDACVMALVESVKRCRLAVLSDSIKKATLNISPTCRENLYNFLNCKLVSYLDHEFVQKLQQLLNSVSEYLKGLENDKVPKVRMAYNALVAVLDDFNLIYNNISTISTSSTVVTEASKPVQEDNGKPAQEQVSKLPKEVPKLVRDVSSKPTQQVHSESTQQDVTKPREEEAEKSNLDCTTTADSSATSEEFTSAGVPEGVPEVEVLDSVLMGLLDNLTHIVDTNILATFKKYGSEGSNRVLEDGLRQLSVWLRGNEKLLKSVDYYVVKLISYLYSKFTNVELLQEFFNQLLNYQLTDEAFNELVEVIKVNNALKLLNTLLLKDNANTNKLLNPLNAYYYKDSTCLTHFISILQQYFSQSYVKLPSSVMVKVVNFVVYNVKSKLYVVSRMSLELLSAMNERSEVVSYLDKHLRNTLLYLKPSDTLKNACKESQSRVEKYVSKDLFNCMFKDKSNIKRSCEYWKRFLSKRDEKSDNMLLGKARKDLTSWLSYTMYEMKCEKVVLEIFDIMADYMSLKCEFDEEESLLLLTAFVSYSFFGKYQLKALSVFSKLVKLFRNSFESLEFLFEAVDNCSEKWKQLMSEALVRLVRNATPTESLVQFLKRKLDSCFTLESTHKRLIYQWINNFTSPILNTNNLVGGGNTVDTVDRVSSVSTLDRVPSVSNVNTLNPAVNVNRLESTSTLDSLGSVDTVDTVNRVESANTVNRVDYMNTVSGSENVNTVPEVDNSELNRMETVCEDYEQAIEPLSTTGSASDAQFPIQYTSNFVTVSIQTDDSPINTSNTVDRVNMDDTSNSNSAVENVDPVTTVKNVGKVDVVKEMDMESAFEKSFEKTFEQTFEKIDCGNFERNISALRNSVKNKSIVLDNPDATTDRVDNSKDTTVDKDEGSVVTSLQLPNNTPEATSTHGTVAKDTSVSVMDKETPITMVDKRVDSVEKEKMNDQVILDEDVTNDVESCKSLAKQIISSNSPPSNTRKSNTVTLDSVSFDSVSFDTSNVHIVNENVGVENSALNSASLVNVDVEDGEFYEENGEVTTISCTSRYNQCNSPINIINTVNTSDTATNTTNSVDPVNTGNRVDNMVENLEEEGSDESYPSVVVEYDSDSELACGDDFSLSLVESVLSHCSKVNKICLVSSYKEYKSLSSTLCQEDVSKVCLDSCSEILKYKNVLKYLAVPLVEMTHNAILLMTKRIIDSTLARDNTHDTFVEPLILTIEVFKSVTMELNENFILQFCNVVTNLLSLPKQLFQNERLYCITSSLVSENGLKQSNHIISKMLMVMVELSMESLKGEVDRLLMAKLRFTKILQMQLLINSSQNNSTNIVNSVTNSSNVGNTSNIGSNRVNSGRMEDKEESGGMNGLKSVHVDFIERLEKFANKSSAHSVEKVIQTSNYIISTI